MTTVDKDPTNVDFEENQRAQSFANKEVVSVTQILVTLVTIEQPSCCTKTYPVSDLATGYYYSSFSLN